MHQKRYPTQIHKTASCVAECLLNTERSLLDYVGRPCQLSLHQTRPGLPLQPRPGCVALPQSRVLGLQLGEPAAQLEPETLPPDFWSKSKPDALGHVTEL